MSLEQLERQIEIATLAMEKATKSGNKKMKSEMRQELSNFQKVVETSRARLKELEAIKKKCDELSACREVEQRLQKRTQELEEANKVSKNMDNDHRNELSICNSGS